MEQMDILRHAVKTLERLQVPYLVVGSFASIAYGESRFTQDIDIVVALEMKHVPGLIQAFPQPEYYLNEPAIRDAIRSDFQFNVIHPDSGNKIDFILPKKGDWPRAKMSRGRPVRLLPDRDVMTAAPEDVILGKLWYYAEGGGDRHLRDIAGILRVTGEGVDRAEVDRWARQLGYLEIWEAILARVDGPDLPTGPGAP
jgi:predicted nucleotidyltransferase